MRILCGHHVPPRYVQAFEQASWITGRRLDDVLETDAPDEAISRFAASNRWVVFTRDTDFYRLGTDHGLLVYSQLDDPRPGDVVRAIRAIDEAYDTPAAITEPVPGAWLDR